MPKIKVKKTADDTSIYTGGDVNSIYKKLEHKQHILELPDTYIGSVERHHDELYVLDETEETPKILKRNVEWVPGLVNIFNEILVNVTDQWTRLNGLKKRGVKKLTKIDVNINAETGEISIRNNGDGIDAELLKDHDKYPVELIFGELLTSTNYNKKEEKVVGGKNGYGAKLTNIYSKYFCVESVDRFRKKRVTVRYHDNMKKFTGTVYSPTIDDEEEEEEEEGGSHVTVESYTGEPYTCVTFIPDYKRFGGVDSGLDGLTDDIVAIMKKRVYDAAAWTDHRVRVSLNGTEIPTKTFVDYVSLYLGDFEAYPRVYANVNARWEIIVTTSRDDHFEQVSFVNGINTIRGGKHVDHVVDQLRKGLTEAIQKKTKITIRKGCIRDQLMVFVKAQIVNPSFDSQTKETLTTNASKFGSKCSVDKAFIDSLVKQTPIVERIIRLMEYKGSKMLNRTDGSKRSRIKVPKLDDANWAGGTKSKRCTLILTEGDSAKTMAIAGLSVVGRDAYGVFPLRGKILNVRDANVDKIGRNKEITALKQILGLKSNATYDMETTPWPLRYGKIMIMTDQDTDGSHIKGLLFNIFHNMWPSLLREDFLTSMLTPVVKVSRGKQTIPFYNLTHYHDWKKANKNGKNWNIKYYKGLGTSTSKEAKEYFRDLRVVKYSNEGGACDDSIDLAFNKKRADDRKTWLQNYDSDMVLNPDSLEVSYREFIHKELIHFSNEDLRRSVPSICDGLKPSQRKILYCAFKRKLKKEVKVAQLSGYVSEHSAYHHGETSLQMAIVGLAQDFVGSNNINLFLPNGQFGSRLLGGKDSASPRYICTALSPITGLLFPQEDFPLLDYLNDDGYSIEPNFYVPILPTALINGCKGIGTGYSTCIPNYDPIDILNLVKRRMRGPLSSDSVDIKPSYRGFRGKILRKHKKDGEPLNCYITKGIYNIPSITQIEITELPVGVWTEDYKEFLDSITIDAKKMKGKKITINSKQFIKSYVNHSTETEVRFLIKIQASILNKMRHAPNPEPEMTFIEKRFKLTTNANCTNMHLYNSRDAIQKYSNVVDIIDEFYKVRLDLYVRRKAYIEATLQCELDVIEARVQFIKDYIADVIVIKNTPQKKLEARMKELNYPRFDLTHAKDSPLYNPSYDYLNNMRLYMLTKEKVDELLKLCDKKRMELAVIKGKTPQDLWTRDLGEFTKSYNKLFLKKSVVEPVKIKKKRVRVKKTVVAKEI